MEAEIKEEEQTRVFKEMAFSPIQCRDWEILPWKQIDSKPT